MHSKYVFIGILLVLFGRIEAQNPNKMSFNYSQTWKKVQALEDSGLNVSALKLVDKIKTAAKAENKSVEILKAVMVQVRLSEQMEEEALPKSIRIIEEELKTASFPLKNMLYTILAGKYRDYYQNMFYRYGNRTETINFKNDDITTWSVRQIVEKTMECYRLSLADGEKLKKTPTTIFKDVLTSGNKLGRAYRPTLYDFLAHEAVDFYMNNESELTTPAYSFTINSADYFLEVTGFVNLNIVSRDTFAYKYYALKIFQELLRFHLKDPNPDALVDVDLKRLDFVNQYSTVQNKDDIYMEALQKLAEKYKNSAAAAMISVRIAQTWNQKANEYNPLQTDDHKWDRKKAYEICASVIKQFPGTGAAAEAFNMQQQIKIKEITSEVEKVNLPGQPFRALVGYRNFSNLYWRIVPVNYKELLAVRQKWEKKYDYDQDEKFLEHILAKAPVKTGKVVLPGDGDYNLHRTEIKLDAPGTGNYCILFSNNESFSLKNNVINYVFTTVSNLAYFHRNRDNGSSDLHVIDRTTGEPIAGATVQIYKSEYNQLNRWFDLVEGQKFVTNEEGYTDIPFQYSDLFRSSGSFELSVVLGKDTINTFDLNIRGWTNYGHFYQGERRFAPRLGKTIFFLDRAIYRPGQTLYYKGLYITTDGKTPEIVPDRKLTITFYDVNSQVVGRQEVITNKYGTFSGTFTTPSSGLMGQMRLSSDDQSRSSAYFSVEEYKRPKFEVKFEPVKGPFKLGEKVTVTGKALAYSGANIDGAKVQYRVVRRAVFPFWWWCWYGYYPQSPDMEIVNGKDTTSADGGFKIDFTAIPDESVGKKSSPTFIYEVSADVTDINGETHIASTSVSIGYKSLMLGVNVRDIDKNEKADTSGFHIKTTNLAGEFEPASGNITIWKLKTPEKAFRERYWQRPDKFIYSKEEYYKLFPYDLYQEENNFYKWAKEKEVLNVQFNTAVNKKLQVTNLNEWLAGKYMLEIAGKDKYGEEVKEVAYFEVMDNQSATPAMPSVFTVKDIKASGEPGEKAVIVAASSEKVKYLFEIERDGVILEHQWLISDGQQKMMEIQLKEEHRGNIAIHLITVKNNRMYSNSRTITIPYSNKKLDVKFETFRDKLLPGEQEQWKIKISSKYADKTMAEMVATLYDASLDAFVTHSWNASLYNSVYSRLRWQSLNGFGSYQFQQFDRNWNSYNYKDVMMPEYQSLQWYYGHNNMSLAVEFDEVLESSPAFIMVEESASFAPPPAPEDAEGGKLKSARMKDTVSLQKSEAKDEESKEPAASGGGAKKQDFSEVKARKNFNETAFFYPHLQTNEQGEIIVSFTIPEALTRWKMLGFAHTTDLKSAMIQKELVTQKDLMIVPNQPRFFRENDKMVFQAKVNSLVDKELEGQARLEFFDALTMQPVDALLKNNSNIRDFKLKARQSANLEWNIEIPEGLQALTYRIVARSGEFSDGEEMMLPVVTNRTLVTETMPLPIRGKQTKEFTFEKMANNTSTTLKHHRYTLEFTSNPAWYAIQALPYLIEYPYECTEQTFSRFYANSIASHIANSNPNIKHVFDTWANIQPDALLSNLEKNQELKTALLQETPWVLNAKSESQRKRNVALLFDLNRMAGEQEKALKKIQEAQLKNGGFSWFPGLPEDLYITQYIVSGLGHLETMGVKYNAQADKVNDMLRRAILFMDLRMKDRYDFLKAEVEKKRLKLEENNLGYIDIQYLYARSYFKNIALQNQNKEAFDYWMKQAEKYWLKQNLYAQGMLALAMKRNGKAEVASAIVRSLIERSLNSEEIGMYWKLDRGYFWYEAPVETQALMIEVFDEVAGDTKAVEDMKVWLLKQKQTQDWKTTKATSEACYALLRRGSDVLSSNKLAEITVGDEKIDPFKREDTKVEAGTGYFKTAWTASEVKPEMGKVRIKKTDEGVAWGAVYWQYFEQLDKITSAETPLKLSKKLFREVNTDRGPVITPVTDSDLLSVGDIVKVRIELRADRTMEYIHLKDMRASAFEPAETLSGYKYQDGLWYYQSPGDLATNFFIGYLPKGTYVFEYSLRVSQKGDFSNGITTIQCMYAPEFSSHSEGVRVKIEK